MKRILLLAFLLPAMIASAQKKVTVKKGDIKSEGQVIAQYDGVGSIFKEVRVGIFAPGSKDTIISVTEVAYDPKNPLFPDPEVVYKLQFKNTSLAPLYVCNPKRKGVRFMERDVTEMVFNDSVPLLVANGKLDESAVEQFRSRYRYHFEEILQFVKGVEDTIAILNSTAIQRDQSKAPVMKIIADKSDQFEVNQVFEIYQGGVLLGKVHKQVTLGTYPKAKYSFWKSVPPTVVDGIDFKGFSPVASCQSGPTTFDIPVIAVVGKGEYKIKGAFNALENQIIGVLVANKLL